MTPKPVQTPEYALQSFLDACKEGTAAVFVRKPALEDAKVNFGMHTQKEVLLYLAEMSVEDFKLPLTSRPFADALAAFGKEKK